MHQSKGTDYVRRFWQNVEAQEDGCWHWVGYVRPTGYATFYMGGGRGAPKRYVHRIAYALLIGDIPDDLEIDHLCRVRNCVNPAHLEAVTRQENMRRVGGDGPRDTSNFFNALKTHCKQGHELTEENTYRYPGKKCRDCRTCRADRQIKSRAKRRAETAA